jgi:hypothetical protein
VDGELDVRPAEPPDDDGRVAHVQAVDDLVPDRWGRGSGERQHRRPPDGLDRGAEPEVVGPEVRSPPADQVGLVDGHQLRLQLRDAVEDVDVAELFRTQEHEVRPPGTGQVIEDATPLACPLRRVHRHRHDVAPSFQRRQLIPLQGEQGRDHHGRAAEQEARQLVDRRLAASRRHHHERVLAVRGALDRFALPRSKRAVAEQTAGERQDGIGVRRARSRSGRRASVQAVGFHDDRVRVARPAPGLNSAVSATAAGWMSVDDRASVSEDGRR